MGLTRTVRPDRVPVEIVDLRRWINWLDDDSTHDAELERLAEDAADTVERHVRTSLITQTWQWQTHADHVFEAPRPPLQSVESIRAFNRDNVATTIDPADYAVITGRSPGLIVMREGFSWPTLRQYEPIEITFVCGFGDESADVPVAYRTALMQLVAFEFEHRGDREIEMPAHIRAKLRGLASGTAAGFFAGRI